MLGQRVRFKNEAIGTEGMKYIKLIIEQTSWTLSAGDVTTYKCFFGPIIITSFPYFIALHKKGTY
mgnify:CR=1 FL=1